ncbi:MAG: serine hydrolase domain-containing protein, partial [Halobacteriaceae archaeon]
MNEQTREEIASYIHEWVQESGTPGASIAMVDEDGVWTQGFGARNLSANEPATPNTLYGVASCTKSFTALAVRQLANRDEITLADPISNYIDLYDGLENPPSIESLLTHTSGMPSDGASVALISRSIGEDPVTVPLSSDSDLRRYVDSHGDDRSPGRFFYYNTGYTA